MQNKKVKNTHFKNLRKRLKDLYEKTMIKKNKLIYILLSIIFVFAFVLRVWFLKDNALTFGYDQARDFLVVQQILSGDIKIQGPPSSTPGLFHGVFYYYLLAPSSFIGNGSPVVIAYWLAFLNSFIFLSTSSFFVCLETISVL